MPRPTFAHAALVARPSFCSAAKPSPSPRRAAPRVRSGRAHSRPLFSDGGRSTFIARCSAQSIQYLAPFLVGRPVTSKLCSRNLQCKETGADHSPKGKKRRNKKRSTGPSRVVPHRSTTPARTCLTSLFGWEAVSQADMAALLVWQEHRYRIPTSACC